LSFDPKPLIVRRTAPKKLDYLPEVGNFRVCHWKGR